MSYISDPPSPFESNHKIVYKYPMVSAEILSSLCADSCSLMLQSSDLMTQLLKVFRRPQESNLTTLGYVSQVSKHIFS